jgi:hypothetical protein
MKAFDRNNRIFDLAARTNLDSYALLKPVKGFFRFIIPWRQASAAESFRGSEMRLKNLCRGTPRSITRNI